MLFIKFIFFNFNLIHMNFINQIKQIKYGTICLNCLKLKTKPQMFIEHFFSAKNYF